MKIINTEGMALIGPGSEWLWSIIGGLLAVASLLAIYRQLRMQRGARIIAEIEAANREWNSEAMGRRLLAILTAIRDGTDPADFPRPALVYIGQYFDHLGYLAKRSHLDLGFLYDFLGRGIRAWWAWLGPFAALERERQNAPWIGRDFEWLARQMADLDQKAGITRVYDDAWRTRELSDSIGYWRALVQGAEEARAVIVRPVTATLTREG